LEKPEKGPGEKTHKKKKQEMSFFSLWENSTRWPIGGEELMRQKPKETKGHLEKDNGMFQRIHIHQDWEVSADSTPKKTNNREKIVLSVGQIPRIRPKLASRTTKRFHCEKIESWASTWEFDFIREEGGGDASSCIVVRMVYGKRPKTIDSVSWEGQVHRAWGQNFLVINGKTTKPNRGNQEHVAKKPRERHSNDIRA